MSRPRKTASRIAVRPLTPERWDDLAAVFGRGICRQCWCMYWRAPRKKFEAAQGEPNRRRFQARVAAGPPPGLLAYADGEPVGWVQVSPRADVPQWNGARVVEACPVETEAKRPNISLYHGIASSFSRAGFKEVARRRPDRPLMRLEI